MAESFPLNSAEWFGALPVASMTLDPVENVVGDMTGAGEWITHEVAPALWQGEVTLGRMTPREAAHASVMLDLLRPPGRLFWLYDLRRPAPFADPTGRLLGANVPVLASVPIGQTLTLTGLPVGYVLTRGDLLGFGYDGGRRALHRVVNSFVRADLTGSATVDVSTTVRPGALAGAPVTLVKAAIPCLRVPGSISTGSTRATITEGVSFRFVQSLGVIA